MPLELVVHAPNCETRRSPCGCTPLRTADPEEAVRAHGGDPSRLEFVGATPPPKRLPEQIPADRSQAKHHRAISW